MQSETNTDRGGVLKGVMSAGAAGLVLGAGLFAPGSADAAAIPQDQVKPEQPQASFEQRVQTLRGQIQNLVASATTGEGFSFKQMWWNWRNWPNWHNWRNWW